MIVQNREDVTEGLEVDIIQKEDQRTGNLTRGIVQEILTSSATHPHGTVVLFRANSTIETKRVASMNTYDLLFSDHLV